MISEVAGNDNSIDYTDATFTVTVEVTDAGNGQLNAQIVEEESDEVAFVNYYEADGMLVLDNFTKTLTGSALTAGQFTFQLKNEAGQVIQTVTNKADGTIAFNALTFDEGDIGRVFEYTVSEVDTDEDGITYDSTVYTVRITVSDGAGSTGSLSIDTEILEGTTEIQPAEGERLPEVTFANNFSGSVTLNKRGSDGRILAGAEFTLYAAAEGGRYEIYTAGESADGVYTTDEDGKIVVTGLPANDYYSWRLRRLRVT